MQYLLRLLYQPPLIILNWSMPHILPKYEALLTHQLAVVFTPVLQQYWDVLLIVYIWKGNNNDNRMDWTRALNIFTLVFFCNKLLIGLSFLSWLAWILLSGHHWSSASNPQQLQYPWRLSYSVWSRAHQWPTCSSWPCLDCLGWFYCSDILREDKPIVLL